jgi:isoquinoline 1-oxidoreductase beta subunit
MNENKQLNRREFLKASTLLTSSLLISFTFTSKSNNLSSFSSPQTVFAPNAFLRIGEDNSITIILSKVEMGQGIWTTLAMLIAEELDCDINKIMVQHSPVGKEYHHTVFGLQATVGSSSTWSEFDRYRLAGATARTMLVEAAAQKWGVGTHTCRTENGYIIAGKKRISYGHVAAEAAKLPVPTVKLREPKEWKYIGKPQKRLDSPGKVNGKAQYGLDIQLPGMLIAVVERAPVFGGKVRSFDATKSKLIKGVRDVVQIPSGIAVLADNYWAAKLGRESLKIDWQVEENSRVDSKLLLEEYRKLSQTKGKTAQEKGNVEAALKGASKIMEAEMFVPYLAHAPMEPLNCTVKISKDTCEIWTGTQLPGLDQAAVAAILKMKPEQVIIHTPFLGGGFGRRGSFNSDWVVEAVNIAKESGRVIKVVWSREDDIRGGYYRPTYLHRARIGIGHDGFPIAWQHRIVGQNTFAAMRPNVEIDDSSVEAVKGSCYLEAVADHTVELHTTTVNVPVLPWRSVGNSHTCLAMESFIDELAFLAEKDPVEYRRGLLKNHPRHLAVLNLAAKASGWNTPLPKGTYRGISLHEAYGSYVSQVVELSVENRKVKVKRVVCAIDCGLAVNPDGVVAQMESGIVFGLTAALYGEISFEKGEVRQHNFHDYRMLRINEMPLVEVHILPSTEKMGGAGEAGVPPIAPALVNALFAATGKRIRRLPVRLKDLL